MIRVLYTLLFTVALAFALFGSKYIVVFEEKPEIKDKKVYFKGMPIGEIGEFNLSEKGYVTLEVEIDGKYRKFIKNTGVFYVEDGKLNYTLMDEGGERVKPGKELLGFESKGKYLLFKAKVKFGKLVKNIEKAIEDIKSN